jgi:hypothetical protein
MKVKYDEEFEIYEHFCPACNSKHSIPNYEGKPHWDFNGNFDSPTFTPSINLQRWNGPDNDPQWLILRCHYFIRDGLILYQTDCTHSMAGQTTKLPDLVDA